MTEMGSQVRQLGEVAQFINGGAWSQSEYSNCGIPVVQVSNIRGNQIDLTDCKYLPKSSLEKYARHLIRQDDLIIATVGSHPSQPNSVVGRPAIARSNAVNALLNQNAVIVRSTCDDVDQKWLGWLGRDQPFRDYIIGCARGSANQVRMAIGLLKQMRINIPPLRTQRRIAEILGAYDDLIQVNRRRIAVLEEMARGLFTEWFIRLRFPGHEDVAVDDTPDGPLPVGWSWGRFADLASEVRDTVLPEAVDSAMPYIGLEHISRRSTTLAERGAAADVSSLKARFRRGDILFGKIRPYFHKVAWAPFEGVASTDAIIWRPTRGLAAQALLQASDDAFVAHSVQTSNGTKMPRANNRVLADYRCALAPSNISDRFEKAVWPMIESAAALQASNANLAAARDLLLPRLISGQLSVTEAERELEAA